MKKIIELLFIMGFMALMGNAHAKTANDWLSECIENYHSESKEKNAVTLCSKAIELSPTNDEAYRYRGSAKSILGDDEGAIKDFDKAIEFGDGYAFYYYLRGASKFALNNITAAYEDYLLFMEAENPNENQVSTYCETIANDAAELNNEQLKNPKLREFHQKCISEFQDYIDESPKSGYQKSRSIDAYHKIARTQTLLKDYRGALKSYDAALKIDDEDRTSLGERGTFKEIYLKDNQGALSDYNRAISLADDQSVWYSERAALYRKLNMKQEACADLKKIVELDNTQMYWEDTEYCKP